jgi:hypothetical protein
VRFKPLGGGAGLQALTHLGWFLVVFWGLAVLAIGLGIVISAEEYITEKFYSSGSTGDPDAKDLT